jgi:hypothetical protein
MPQPRSSRNSGEGCTPTCEGQRDPWHSRRTGEAADTGNRRPLEVEIARAVEVGVEAIGCQPMLAARSMRDPDDRWSRWCPGGLRGWGGDTGDEARMVPSRADPDVVDSYGTQSPRHPQSSNNERGNAVEIACEAASPRLMAPNAELMCHVMCTPRAGDGCPTAHTSGVPDEAVAWRDVVVETSNCSLDALVASRTVLSAKERNRRRGTRVDSARHETS